MLTFKQKKLIIETFPQLKKKEISLNRLNYHFEDSLFEKTIVVEKLHPNGNGFVYVGDMPEYQKEANDKGLVNIRNYNEQALREIITHSIEYLAKGKQPYIELWTADNGTELQLIFEDRNWSIYYNSNLEEVFGTREAAVEYLHQEGYYFKEKKEL